MDEKYFLILTIFLLIPLSGCLEEENKEKAIDFQLEDINGNTFNLSDYLGKVALINFFATWCEPCKTEMTDLLATYEKYGDTIIMISIDYNNNESLETIREFKNNYSTEWIFARDTNEELVKEKYNVFSIPMTFIIDTKGYISYSHLGPVKYFDLNGEIVKASI